MIKNSNPKKIKPTVKTYIETYKNKCNTHIIHMRAINVQNDMKSKLKTDFQK